MAVVQWIFHTFKTCKFQQHLACIDDKDKEKNYISWLFCASLSVSPRSHDFCLGQFQEPIRPDLSLANYSKLSCF